MRLLRIEGGNGEFLRESSWVSILDIRREDLLALIRTVAISEEVELMPIDDEHEIKNQIARDIYEKVYENLQDLHANRDAYLMDQKKRFDELERSYGL